MFSPHPATLCNVRAAMDYTSLKVTELRAILKERNIPSTGLKLKADIIDRIVSDDQEKENNAAAGNRDAPVPVATDQEEVTQAIEALPEPDTLPNKDAGQESAAQDVPHEDPSEDLAAQTTQVSNNELGALPNAVEPVVKTALEEDKSAAGNTSVPAIDAPVAEESRKRRASPDSPPSPDPKRAKPSDEDTLTSKVEEAKENIAKSGIQDAPDLKRETQASEEQDGTNLPEDRKIDAALHPATAALYISQLIRPISVPALEDHLASLASPASPRKDPIRELHVDAIRTHALVIFSSTDAATLVRDNLHNTVWPAEPARKPLSVDFLPEDTCADFIARERDPANDRNTRWQVEYRTSAQGTTVELVDTSHSAPRPRELPGQKSEEADAPPPQDDVRDRENAVHSPSSGKATKQSVNAPPVPSSLPNPQLRNLDECFRSTTAKPKLYWLPVSDESAGTRLSALRDATSGGWNARRDFEKFGNTLAGSGLDQLRRYTFEDGRVVDGGAEWSGSAGGRGGFGGGRRAGGYGGPSRGGRFGGRPRAGGDRYVPP